MFSNLIKPWSIRRFGTSSIVRNAPKSIDPSRAHFKVGLIQEIEKHPDADKLYVSKIKHSQDETVEPYTVCSGLADYIPKESLLGSKVILVANLKATKMRGIKSEAMLLAADKEIDSQISVEVVTPPKDAQIGDNLFFKPYIWESKPPSKMKPKVWDEIQKKLFTDDQGNVFYDDEKPLRLTRSDSEEGAYVTTLTGASVR